MMRRFPIPRPTENQAIGRTQTTPMPSAPVPELRSRLCRAIATDDGHGTRMLAAHLARAAE